ncbi:deaminase [Nocardiopsis sp. NPDC049922]|uniref:deoxycytidylate deaminase n=1 Tax=Nocardiopsis sp. NPDC049922 TaxID=3155157 RepID=UPI00340003BF
MDERPSWVEYFFGIAEAVSRRADCSRRQVGAVIVSADQRIQATGYNGAPPRRMGCLHGACPRARSEVESGSSYSSGPGLCIAIHAEANALLYSSRDDRLGSVMYVTHEPCPECTRLLEGSGLSKVLWPSPEGEGVRSMLL